MTEREQGAPEQPPIEPEAESEAEAEDIAEDAAEDELEEDLEEEEEEEAARPPVPARSSGARPAPVAATPSEIAVRIDDRISKLFVIAVTGTFVAILAYGLLFGSAGLFTPLPTPVPSPSPSAGASASPSASASPAPSPSPSPS